MGNYVHRAIGERAFHICLHRGWVSAEGYDEPFVLPADGYIDAAMCGLTKDERRGGFDVTGSPFAELPGELSLYKFGYERFTLSTNRVGPLPIINHFLKKLELESLLEEFIPTRSARTKLPYWKALGVLLRSILVEREPIYRQQEMVDSFTPSAFGLKDADLENLSDDGVGRALDRLFAADRGSLLTAAVVAASKRFEVRFDELHNDSTTVKFSGQYKAARGRSIRGHRHH